MLVISTDYRDLP